MGDSRPGGLGENMKHDFRIDHARTEQEIDVQDDLGRAFLDSEIPIYARLQAFPAFTRRQDLSRFIVRHNLFLLQLGVSGSIVELGVYGGGSLFSWLHFSSIYEPYNHSRKIFGFDTFAGFPAASEEDFRSQGSYDDVAVAGGLFLSEGIIAELEKLSDLHDKNRPIGHIRKVHLIQGDVAETVPKFVAEHPHVPISLLYLDLDLYEPTKVGLEQLLPRVVSGGVIAFDEFGHDGFPGETIAAFEGAGFGRFERSPLDPHIAWMIKN